MSESSFRGLTPVTAPESIFSSSPNRKLRLRIISRPPLLPELQFLAPFDPSNQDCFGALQRFVYSHVVSRSKEVGGLEGLGWEKLRFWMDGFEVPFEDADILRDGDVLEVQIGEETGEGEEEEEEDAGLVEENYADDAEEEAEEEDADEEELLQQDAKDADERDAILQATRVAALLRAGIHTTSDNDDTLPTSMHHPASEADLPRMPTLAPKPAKAASSKAPLPTTKGPTLPMSPPMPMMPMPPTGGAGSGASAAMAAFEARRKQMQLSSATSIRNGSTPQKAATATTSILTKSVADQKKRCRESSSSSSSSSEGSTDSSSSSGSDAESDSDSTSSSSSSGDDDDDDDDDHSSSSSSSTASSLHSHSSDSTSDSDSSDSAPSVQHTQSDRHRHTFSDLDSDPETKNLVPPGSGTSRTRRRNQMRRKKQQLLREQKSHSHALSQNGDAAEVEEDGGFAWVMDREPMYRIKGVGSVSTHAAGADGGESMPPGGGSFGLVPTVDAGKSKKRKRNDEQEPSIIAVQLERQRNPTLADSSPDVPPYGGTVPEGMAIRHVDCQRFYEAELERLEGETFGDDDGDDGGGAEGEVWSGDKDKSQGKGKGRQSQLGDEVRDGVEDLDYGPPHEEHESSGPRKKLKLDATNPPSPPSSLPSSSSSSSSSSTAHLHPWHATLPKPPFFTNSSNLSLYQPVQWAHLQPQQIVTWAELTLHPLHLTPAMMRFIGLIRRRLGKENSVEVTKIGPLLQQHQGEEQQEERNWDDYEVEEVVWGENAVECPAEILLVK